MHVLFFDGCHKIYYAGVEEHETIEQMEGYGYDAIYTNHFVDDLQFLWETSCFLRFVSPANLDSNSPAILQGDEREDIRDFGREIVQFLNQE